MAQTGAVAAVPKMYPGATTPDGFITPPHPSAPEGYMLKGLPGNMPWAFFLGYSAHRAIAFHYESYHPQSFVYKNFISVATIVRKTGGNEDLLPWSVADLRPDITDVNRKTGERFVYEIKPRGDVHLAKGKEKLAHYIAALNLGMAGTSKVFVPGPDYKGELVLQFKRGKGCWYLEWSTTAPGLLQYTIRQLHPVRDKDGVATMNECAKAQKEGKWTDLSDKAASDDARAVFEDVEGMVRRREKLAQVRDVTTVPIEAIGTLAELILSAGLSLQMNTAPQVGIGVGNEVPFGPPPKPLPPVNARSLGSDTRMIPRNPRPGTSGKTPKSVEPN